MLPIEIKKNIHWVGVIDWNVRDFHGYSTNQGTTYNSYLVIDEKTALFDTVKKDFWRDFLNNIESICDPGRIDYLIINHVELDHSGCLPQVIDRIKPEKIFCSPMGEKAIIEHFPEISIRLNVVKTGDEISLGKRIVKFLESPMLHWPDSMCSYLAEDKVLISNDIFGQHWATNERFDDEVDFTQLMHHSAKYYANIVLPYSKIVLKFLDFVKSLNLEVDLLATDHGLIWRSHINEIISAYEKWAKQESKRKVLIIYDTMWDSTGRMAKAIENGLTAEGVSVKVLNVRNVHRSDVMTEILDAKGLIFGSPTLNNGFMPTLADNLSYIKGLRPEGKIGAAFGSFGWGGEAVKLLNEAMEEMKIEVIDPGIRVKYVPNQQQLEQCYRLGIKVAKAVKETV